MFKHTEQLSQHGFNFNSLLGCNTYCGLIIGWVSDAITTTQ